MAQISGSQEYMRQLSDYGEMPDFQTTIAEAYDKPVIRPIVEETNKIEGQWLPTIFDTFANMGTGAGDMSAAAKLQQIGGSLGRLGSRAGSMRDVQDFYKMQVGDIANREANRWQNNYSRLKDLYSMAFQREEAQRADARARAQIEAMKWQPNLGGGGVQGGEAGVTLGKPRDLQELNALRTSRGYDPVGQDYWDNVYTPRPQAADMSYLDHFGQRFSKLIQDPRAPIVGPGGVGMGQRISDIFGWGQ